MAGYTAAKRRLNGSFGHLQVDGADWGEVSAVQIAVEVGYADVQMGMDVGKKMTKRAGSGSFTVSKAYSRAADVVESVKAGKQPTVRLVAWVSDPDAENGQEERVSIDDIAFTKLDVLTFSHGELMKSEFPFTFTPADLKYLDRINPAE